MNRAECEAQPHDCEECRRLMETNARLAEKWDAAVRESNAFRSEAMDRERYCSRMEEALVSIVRLSRAVLNSHDVEGLSVPVLETIALLASVRDHRYAPPVPV